MELKNTQTTFGFISKKFHWIMAFLICLLLVVGFYMVGLDNNPDKFKIYGMHKSFGLLVLWLAGLRILWRFYNSPPQGIKTHKNWEKLVSKIMHFALYIAMIGVPLSGWVMSGSSKYGAKFFGYPMPEIFPKSDDLSGLAAEAHTILAYLLIAVLLLHILGALKHHIIDKDETLIRMTCTSKKYVLYPVLALFLILFGLGIGKFAFVDPLYEKISQKMPENIVN